MIESKEEAYIVFDGRNVTRNFYGEVDWGLIVPFLEEIAGESVIRIVVMPCWIDIDLIRKIKTLAILQLVDVSKDFEWDDRVVLALCKFFNGHYVTNDAQMYKHATGGAEEETWFQNRRVGFCLDNENKPTLLFPESWDENK